MEEDTYPPPFKERNLTRILFDTIGNGGGYVCATNELIRWMSGVSFWKNSHYDQKYNTYTAEQNHFAFAYNISDFGPQSYLNATSDNPYNDFNWYDHGPYYVRGGTNSSYSEKFVFECGDNAAPFTPISPRDIVVLTDGSCGSACNGFIRTIQELRLAKTVGVGGYSTTTNIESAAFAGGVVESLENEIEISEFFESVVPNYTITIQTAPYFVKSFPTSAGTGYSLYEVYTIGTPSVVREFTSFKTDYKINYWQFDNLETLYNLALPFFDQCPSWCPAVTTSAITTSAITTSSPATSNANIIVWTPVLSVMLLVVGLLF